ncbi:MAG: winged helix-turn-helix transcriptional regulator [Halovenus sp.]
MRQLDDTDREILRLLLENARRPYSDIAERVDLSAPAVSDRVERLQESGLIKGFTLDVDRSMLREGVPLLVEIYPISVANDLASSLRGLDDVEHVFETAEGTVVATLTAPEGDVRSVLDEAIDLSSVQSLEVSVLTDQSWQPGLGEAELAPECVECGNTVTSEGETATLDGDVYQFCCPNCKSKFVERYEQLSEGV